jgi:hypothetical protein
VDVHVGAPGIAEAHGGRIRAAAEELLPQHRREVARAADREDVLALPRGSNLNQQPPESRKGERQSRRHYLRRE